MSLDSILDAQLAITAGEVGGKPASSMSTARNAGMQAAFETQLRMAQDLFGEGSQFRGEGSSSSGGDAFVGDAMMYEALTTIARLMQAESLRAPHAATGARPAAAANLGVESATPAAPAQAAPDLSDLGALSARFESGGEGAGSIGYDRTGGTSYGTYQIASKPGTMDRFLTFLDGRAPDLAERLRESGPADTGSTSGGMPETWQAIAAEDPERFGALQHDFISGETYAPARSMILEQTGLDFDNAPPALREVLWSTAVQHGPTGAARIFGKVIDRFVGEVSGGDFNSRLIEGVYDRRKGQFGSSTARVRQAVANRLDTEKQLALNLLGTRSLNRVV